MSPESTPLDPAVHNSSQIPVRTGEAIGGRVHLYAKIRRSSEYRHQHDGKTPFPVEILPDSFGSSLSHHLGQQQPVSDRGPTLLREGRRPIRGAVMNVDKFVGYMGLLLIIFSACALVFLAGVAIYKVITHL